MRVGDHMGGKPAIASRPGELCPIAKIFLASATINTIAAGVAEPWNADALAERDIADFVADRTDSADDLMSRYDRAIGANLAIDYMQISPADSAGADLDQDLAGAWCWDIATNAPER